MSYYTLITGANGEFGHGLISKLYAQGTKIITLDLNDLDPTLVPMVEKAYRLDLMGKEGVDDIFANYDFDQIYHLAALLSTSSERIPAKACNINVMGTVGVLDRAVKQAEKNHIRVKVMFCSTIAVYGLPNLEVKAANPFVSEDQFVTPTTMYGCNKLACEHLGSYYTFNYMQLKDDPRKRDYGLDFRCIRFPGVISAFTLPTGGTSDYAPEMIHAAAKGEKYNCFVRESAKIPFITMPEAIDALMTLSQAPAEKLTRRVYNIGGFAATAGEIYALVRESFPNAPETTFNPDVARQGIVDTWPEDVNDEAARKDWGYKPTHTLRSAFTEYLLPNIKAFYANKK